MEDARDEVDWFSAGGENARMGDGYCIGEEVAIGEICCIRPRQSEMKGTKNGTHNVVQSTAIRGHGSRRWRSGDSRLPIQTSHRVCHGGVRRIAARI